jgi:hypothetical protein
LIVPIGKNEEKAALQETKILPYPINSILFIKNRGEILVAIRWQQDVKKPKTSSFDEVSLKW